MTVYLTPIGYDSTRVTRPILSRGLDAGDRVILLLPPTAKDDKRSSEAVADVQRLLHEIEPDVTLEREYVSYTDLQQAVFTCCEVIRNVADECLIVNFGGGARDIYLALAIAVLNHLEQITSVVRFSDINGTVIETELPDLSIHVPDTGTEILLAVLHEDEPVTLPTLVEAVGCSKSTVTRHVRRVDGLGAVRTDLHGKTKVVELTFTGRLHAVSSC